MENLLSSRSVDNVPEARPNLEQVVQYLEELVPLPDFSPDSLGIGILSFIAVNWPVRVFMFVYMDNFCLWINSNHVH